MVELNTCQVKQGYKQPPSKADYWNALFASNAV